MQCSLKFYLVFPLDFLQFSEYNKFTSVPLGLFKGKLGNVGGLRVKKKHRDGKLITTLGISYTYKSKYI